MAFSSRNLSIDNKKEEPSQAPLSSLAFSKQEIELILLMIKDASFKGERVETIYNLVYKLQQQYTSLNQ
jgi:hypothetical protein